MNLLSTNFVEYGQVASLLPPASEGWGRYCFHRCVSVCQQGVPHGLWSQVPSLISGPRSFPGGGGVCQSCHGSCPKLYHRSCLAGTPVLSLVLLRGDYPNLGQGGYPLVRIDMPLAFTQEDFLVLMLCSRRLRTAPWIKVLELFIPLYLKSRWSLSSFSKLSVRPVTTEFLLLK